MLVHPVAGQSDYHTKNVPEFLTYWPAPLYVPPAGRKPMLGWGLALLPSIVAVCCWPVLFAIFFVMSFTLALMVVTACLVWAWKVSDRLASWCYWRRMSASVDGDLARPTSRYRFNVRLAVFIGQSLAILSSCPLFWMMLTVSTSRGTAPQFWWIGRRLF